MASNSTHGSITIGAITTPTGNTNLQFGLAGGPAVLRPSPRSVARSSAIRRRRPAGSWPSSRPPAPSNFNLFAGSRWAADRHAADQDSADGCGLGADLLHRLRAEPDRPASGEHQPGGPDLSLGTFDPDGTPNPNGPIAALVINGLIQGDSTFSVPGASGCTDDNQVDALLGLPSPSGANNLVLLDATSAIALPQANQNGVEWSPSGIPRSGAPPEHDHDDDQLHDQHDLSRTGLAGWGTVPHPASTFSPRGTVGLRRRAETHSHLGGRPGERRRLTAGASARSTDGSDRRTFRDTSTLATGSRDGSRRPSCTRTVKRRTISSTSVSTPIMRETGTMAVSGGIWG